MEKDTQMAALLDRYGGAVPRYTSYPPATRFQPVGDGGSLQHYLQNLPVGRPVSLYVHIPFCRQLCSYCGCMTRVVHDDAPVRDYALTLEKEISIASTFLSHKPEISHIHFGGGSPNLLSRHDLLCLMDVIGSAFTIRADAEIAMEVDPRQMDRDKAFLYAEAGFNRISLGVQDFQPETQRAINRIQPFSLIKDCVQWLRDAGIGGINFDLIYGLPHQTVATIADNIQKAASLGPDRIALFGYAHVPWMKPHQKILEKYHLPNSLERFAQAEKAREALVLSGYHPIGMDHFAKTDDSMMAAYKDNVLKRNFQGYTNDNAESLIGFGLSAISRFPDAYFQNSSKSGQYHDKIASGLLPVEKTMALDREDILRAEIIESLMCYFQVSYGDICRRHGFAEEFFDVDVEALTGMVEEGLVMVKDRTLSVTPLGKPFLRRVSACFDAYYDQQGENRHARAV